MGFVIFQLNCNVRWWIFFNCGLTSYTGRLNPHLIGVENGWIGEKATMIVGGFGNVDDCFCNLRKSAVQSSKFCMESLSTFRGELNVLVGLASINIRRLSLQYLKTCPGLSQ
ncbi:hypothetical protein TNIN_225701 [Trichonephila inaurata madagascariensis]|uniref:Uncharacterized protein n=1 Tax=Trichonephila inaurata madagascariensis TaxID=2747483 RepID=A0A8X6Y5V6_9ARAC|nr:hypothetical protein TNIN_225701 [Trichonephila inaurata madagascariensis]